MNDQSNSPNESEKAKGELDTLRTIFSKEEVRSTVKAFVLAYLRGTIKIQFDSAEDVLEESKKEGREIDYKKASREEISRKKFLIEDIQIISGVEKSTPEELEEAINNVFSYMLVLRSSERIEGTFLEFDIENRMDTLDHKLSATNEVVSQLVNWLTDEAKGHDKLP